LERFGRLELKFMKLRMPNFLKRGAGAQSVFSIPGIVIRRLIEQWRFGKIDFAEVERLDRLRNPSKYLGKD